MKNSHRVCAWNGPEGLGKETKGIRNQRKKCDQPEYNIAEIGQRNFSHSDSTERTVVNLSDCKLFLKIS